MRLDNLDKASKDRFARDLAYIKKILGDELEGLKDDLIDFPEAQLEQLRGKAQQLRRILQLLHGA